MALGHILSKSISRNEHFDATTTQPPASLTKNLNRLLSAAIVSPRFQQLLLSDAATAIALGYNGEKFHLTPAEVDAVSSVRANSIRDFAAQLLRRAQVVAAESPPYVSEPQAEFRMVKIAAR